MINSHSNIYLFFGDKEMKNERRKIMIKIILLIGIMLLLTSNVFASQEGVLRLSSFTMQSEGIGESGPVSVSGTTNEENEFTELTVKVFGKEYKLSDEDLKKIPAKPYNGIQLSYEAGYKELGGKTLYIILQVGFTSGIKERTLIIITESGSIQVECMEE